ncbi:hypothetical protein niasHT_024733 [Heterodera trifolii]|uniref:Uncharacterized protein n=1 Tax=Heterodera trifolii TaxID=157864 RepID=A0ABD2K458_9BILA
MLSAGSSSPVRSKTLCSSISGNELHGLGAMVPYRRPSAGPETTSTSTSAAPITTTLARSSSTRRRHRRYSNSTQWRSNTYSGTDECCGSVELLVGNGSSQENGGKLSSAPAATILSLREAMRELARPQMQLCIGGGSSAPPSSSSSTLCVAGGGNGGGDQKQRRRSSGGSDGKHSSISPPSREMALKQQKHQQQQRMCTTKILLTADDAEGATMTTRSASVCYPPGAQQLSRRCSTTTRNGRLERSNSLIAGRGSSTLAFLPELNPQQVANLRRTWKHINTKGLYDIIRRSFRKVESAHSSVAMAFRQNAAAGGGSSSAPTAQADGTKHAVTENSAGSNGKVPPLPPQTKFCGVMEHSKYFMVLLNRIIDGDGNNHQEDLERELKLIGARHVIVYKRFGVGVTEIERTGEALAEALFKLDGIRQSKEATKVWRVLIAKIIDHIVTGFTGELRSQRRRTSSALLSSAAGALAAPLFEHNDNATVKRNSVPNPLKAVRSAASNEDDDVDNDSPPLPQPPTVTSSSTTVPTTSLLSANYHNSADERQRQSVGGDCFLRAELAGVVRRLSNL